MLATLGGVLALLLGLVLLLLPLLAAELSRPRDSFWGAVVLLLGLDLVTCADRLTGAPMLGVLCGGLLIGRLGLEVAQTRWFRLTPEEQQRLLQRERWQTVLGQLGAATARMLTLLGGSATGALGWLQRQRQPRSPGKRWVRPEAEAAAATAPADSGASQEPAEEQQPADGRESADGREPAAATEEPTEGPAVTVIASLAEVEPLIDRQESAGEEGSQAAPSEQAG